MECIIDKNNERLMLWRRADTMSKQLHSRIFTDSVKTGDFLFRDGQYKYADIDKGEWTPFGEKDFWGYKEQYCWFKQSVTVPESFKGKPVVYDVTPLPYESWRSSAFQFILYVNGKLVQGIDSNHTFAYLTKNAEGGETFDIALSAYCDDNDYRGYGQCFAYLRTVDKAANDLYFDIRLPLDTAAVLSPDDLPRVDIIKAVNEACNILDLGTPDKEVYNASVKAASEYLHKNLYGESVNATVSAIGHTHIDVAWRWRLRQTRDKAARSFATVLRFMEEYPFYKFMSPQAQLYDYVKQDYPELYEEIKQAVKDGKWEPEGSMWVESDTNVISGESLVRQFLVGKRFFMQEFGKSTKIMWLPDVFGYSAALPQIIKKSGLDYFMTTKISWNEIDKFPYDTFMWQGIDGTEVLSHFIPSQNAWDSDSQFNTTYNSNITASQVIGGWKRYSNKDLNRNVLNSFGHGDGGGGPTREMLEGCARMNEGIPGCPKVVNEFSRTFFDRLAKDVEGSKRLPKWQGELYLEFHRGTLTSQARNKKYNRKCEWLYHDTETLSEIAKILSGAEYPSEKILEAWKIILLNQFHDIIPGSSIYQVYDDSKEQYESITAMGKELAQAAIDAIASEITVSQKSLAVFNTLGMKRDDIVTLDGDVSVYDGDELLPSQKTAYGKTAVLVKNVPSKGYKVFSVKDGAAPAKSGVSATLKEVENDYYKLTFDENMNISSLYFKPAERFAFKEGEVFGRLVAYDDRPHHYEAWDIKSYYDEKSEFIDNVVSADIIESGAVRTVIRIERKYRNSPIIQYYKFYPDTARFDIDYDIDWKEDHIAVKADYPVDVNASKATFDIQFGNIERATNNNTTREFAQFEVCGHKWADLSDNSFGVSVLNDCKYGWTVKEGHIKPTLLRSATEPNPYQDRERHTFTYAVYPHCGSVDTSNLVYEAYCLNAPTFAKLIDKQNGALAADEFSLVSADKDNIVIETVKKAEDSDAVIVRLYETWNRRTPCRVKFGKAVSEIYECDLMEENDTALENADNGAELVFKPFEIKTLKVILK